MPRHGAARAAERRVTAAPPEAKKGARAASASITPETRQQLMDLDFLRGLIEAVDSSSIDWIEINRAGTRIRISKTPPPAPIMTNGAQASATHANHAAAAAAPAAPAPSAAAETTPEPEPAPKSNLVEVKSPMVGTFYRAPAPEAPPYVEVGSTVRKGQTLCILEAMKLMNELESEVDGIVRQVRAENADPVEYGQVLFLIEPGTV
jgi:acetyl-CoA carboxylase biotin carboxyl carrier protein